MAADAAVFPLFAELRNHTGNDLETTDDIDEFKRCFKGQASMCALAIDRIARKKVELLQLLQLADAAVGEHGSGDQKGEGGHS